MRSQDKRIARATLVTLLMAGAVACNANEKAGIVLNVDTAAEVERQVITSLHATVNGITRSYAVTISSGWNLGVITSAGSKLVVVDGLAGTTVIARSEQRTIVAKKGEVIPVDVILLPIVAQTGLDGGVDGPAATSGLDAWSDAVGLGDAGGNAGVDAPVGSGGAAGAAGVGGASAIGGIPGTNGNSSPGGIATGGGVTGTGGIGGVGGTIGVDGGLLTGGQSSNAGSGQGGLSATGGTSAAGGSTASGGITATAGVITTSAVTGTSGTGGTGGTISSTLTASTAGSGGTGGTGGSASTVATASSGGTGGTGGSASTVSGGGMSTLSTAGTGGTGSTGGTGGALSGGCNSSSTVAPCSVAGSPCTIYLGGTPRTYYVQLPTTYTSSTAYPVVFQFHHTGSTAESTLNLYGLRSRFPNAIYVTPQGLTSGSSPWPNTNGQAIALVRAILADVQAKYCVDNARLFSLGFSYGAVMSYTIGCEMSDVFRAIAAMSGTILGDINCNSTSPPIALWASHGTDDIIISLADGQAARDTILRQNHCWTSATPTSPSPCTSYQGCDQGYPVVWCEWDGDHQIPSFGSSAIAAFFAQF